MKASKLYMNIHVIIEESIKVTNNFNIFQNKHLLQKAYSDSSTVYISAA